jgi:hypothetical protein
MEGRNGKRGSICIGIGIGIAVCSVMVIIVEIRGGHAILSSM